MLQENAAPGRNADGTFTKGSEAAKEAGHLGGLHANGKVDEKVCHRQVSTRRGTSC